MFPLLGSLRRLTIIVILFCVSVHSRHILQDFDLDVAAAEPRPIFIETGPSAEALPLVYSEESTNGPLSVASEKVEKVLRPAYSFAYNNQNGDDDGETAEDDNPEDLDYHVEKDKKTDIAKKGDVNEEEGAESKHQEHKHDGGGQHGDHAAEFEKGGGKEHHSHHHGEHGEKGNKHYKGHHHNEKGKKGHHKKEDHSKHYDEEAGHKKDHHHEDGYHGDYHKGYSGKKGYKFDEEGEHSKGHNTKGEHNIHKKEEYDKKIEFFEEDNEESENEKHGGFKHEGHYEKGGHHKGGHKKGGHEEDHYGKEGKSEKGGHYKDEKGHKEEDQHDKHYKHETKYGKKEGQAKGKKWAFKKGDGDDGGGGHGHGAHSHHTYAVQEPLKQQEHVETASIQKYEIPPISTLVLPLERELNNEEIKSKENKERSDGHGHVAHSHHIYAIKEPLKQKEHSETTYSNQKYEITPISTFVLPLEGELNNEEIKSEENKKKSDGHGHVAHSHHTYAIKEPLKQKEDAETASNQKYEITPISTFIFPLEAESNNKGTKSEENREGSKLIEAANDYKPLLEKNKEELDEGTNSKSIKLIKESLDREDFKPSSLNINNSSEDLLLISLPVDPQEVTEAAQETAIEELTTISTIERYISQEMQKNRLPTLESAPAESKTLTKKRRLKKRKTSKVKDEANVRSSRNAAASCKKHNKEKLVPEESSKSFVIVAAEDAF